ncbi:MAG: BamA/TamA family outer membrane protein [Myxococcota bacterium]
MKRLHTTGWLLLLGLTLGWGTPARAATYDPQLTWRTIETEHFLIHFHQGEEALAQHFVDTVEDIYDDMTEEFQWRLRMKTDIVLVDRTDRANGFATAVPYNSITIFVTAPQEDSTLGLYEDWTETIFTHELTHVIHMEANHGIVRAARAVIGRIASTNDLSPWWMIEGLATMQETRHTEGGRGRSPLVQMIKRAAVVDADFPPLGNLDGLQADPPAGNLRYLFGQDFIQYISDHAGRDVWTRWVHTYGSHIPYLLPTRKVFGKTLQRFYDDWKQHVHERVDNELWLVRQTGLREGRLVSDGVASCTAPAFAPTDDTLIWSCNDRALGNAIWKADREGLQPEILIRDMGAKTFTWRRDGKAFVFAGLHIVNRFNTWSDIYLHKLEGHSTRALTSGARARDPDFSPDGSQLLMVTNRVQNTQLEVMTVDQTRTPLTTNTERKQHATPRYSPNGKLIAVSVWDRGRRDLWLYTADGRPLSRLTADAANDRDPAWSSDGNTLYFSSDRTGIPNIFAVDLQTQRLYQVTNVTTGAAKPSIRPDEKLLAYERYSANGWDVYVLDIDKEQWIDRGVLEPTTWTADLTAYLEPATPIVASHVDWEGRALRTAKASPPALSDHAQSSGESLDSFDMTDVKDAFGAVSDYPFTLTPKRYSPARGLLPRYWIPWVNTTPFLQGGPQTPTDETFRRLPSFLASQLPGISVSAATGASDPVRHLGWNARMSYRTDANFLGASGALTINRWLPVLTLGGGTVAVPRTYALVDTLASTPDNIVLLDARDTYFERRVYGGATITFPFTPRSTIFANYNFSWRTVLADSPNRVATRPIADNAWEDSLPLRGTLGELSAGYRYSWGQPTAYAVSREDARTLSLVGSITAPWLGSFALDGDTPQGITQVQLTAELREYVVMPWAKNHVLALRGATGLAFGSQRFVGNYSLGGVIGDGAFYVTPAEYRMIRGYRIGADTGDTYWLTAAEYRFPIWRMDRGIGTIPAFFRVLSGAVFVDAGNAFNDAVNAVDVFDDALVGVGAELRLSTIVGWGGSFSGRLGYGVGLTQNGLPGDLSSLYLQLGGSF